MASAVFHGRTTEPLQLGRKLTKDGERHMQTSSPLESLARQSSLKASKDKAAILRPLDVPHSQRLPGQLSIVVDNGRDALDPSRLGAKPRSAHLVARGDLLFTPPSPLIHSQFRNSTATDIHDSHDMTMSRPGPPSYTSRTSVSSQYSNEGDDPYEFAGITDRFGELDDTGSPISPTSHGAIMSSSFGIGNAVARKDRPYSDASSILPKSIRGSQHARHTDHSQHNASLEAFPSGLDASPTLPRYVAPVSSFHSHSPQVPKPKISSPSPAANSDLGSAKLSSTHSTHPSESSVSITTTSDLFSFRAFESQSSERATVESNIVPVTQQPSLPSSTQPSNAIGRSPSYYGSGGKHNYSRPLRLADDSQPPSVPTIKISGESVHTINSSYDYRNAAATSELGNIPIGSTTPTLSRPKTNPAVPPSTTASLRSSKVAAHPEELSITSPATYRLVMENWAKDENGRPIIREGSVQLQAPYQHSADPRRPTISALQYHPNGPNAPKAPSPIPSRLVPNKPPSPNPDPAAVNRTLSPFPPSPNPPHRISTQDVDQLSLYSNYSYYGLPESPQLEPQNNQKSAHDQPFPNLNTKGSNPRLGAQAAAAALRPVLTRSPSHKSIMSPSNSASTLPVPEGLPKNISSADEYLQLGIQHHEADNLPLSAYCFEHSAKFNGGCGVGMLMWGLTLRHGWGVPKDENKGFVWVRRAAEAAVDDLDSVMSGVDAGAVQSELVLAIYEVGQCYSNGWGVPKDKKMAVSYFQVAARLGDPDAQQELGFCFANGKGCKKNKKEAAKWYRKATEQGVSTVGLAWIYKDKYQ